MRALARLAETRGVPETIVVDNGPEFISHVPAAWAEGHGLVLHFIEPGKPVQNTRSKASTASSMTNA